MVRFELEKNLKHLEILIKQNHTEVEALEVDFETSSDCPAVFIYYSRSKNEFSKLFFDFNDDPLNLYRRILDDIADKVFVKRYCETDAASLYQASVYKDTDSDYIRK